MCRICRVCGLQLNRAQYRNNEQYKSCPNCSSENGEEHVYYENPGDFGETPLRATRNHPEGPQSYCVSCRGNGECAQVAHLCNEFEVED